MPSCATATISARQKVHRVRQSRNGDPTSTEPSKATTTDIRRFNADLSKRDENFLCLMRFEAARAKAYYDESRPLIGLVHKRSRRSLWALIEIYRRLLGKLERSNYDVLQNRIHLTTREKL